MRAESWRSRTSAFASAAGVLLLAACQAEQSFPGAAAQMAPEGVPQFQVDPYWPQPLPENWILGQVAGLWVDDDDHVWIIHRPWSVQPTNAGATPPREDRGRQWGHDPLQAMCCVTAPPVIEFDPEGNVVRAWGGSTDEYQWFNSEHGIHVDHNGFVWVAGNGADDHHIMKFTKDGELVLQIGGVGVNQGSNDTTSVNRAANMEVDPETNELYVADGYGNRRVIVFDAETGAYRRHWGAYGERPTDENPGPYDPAEGASRQFRTPVHAITISDDGLVYVADRPNNRIQVFQKDGTFVREAFVRPETLGPGSTWDLQLSDDPEQRWLFVPDGTNNVIWILERETMEVVHYFGRGGRQPGQFDWLHNLKMDSQGNIYTSEVQTGHRIQKFNRVDLVAAN